MEHPVRARILAAILATAIAAAPTRAHSGEPQPGRAEAGDLTISGAWIRGAPPVASVTAGYLTVTNSGEEADRLVAVEAPFAGTSEIHTTRVEDGAMTMAPVEDGLRIGPGETLTLAPGGHHLMLMALREPPEPGETRTLTLVFEKAGSVTLSMPVSPLGATSLED